MSRPTDGLDPTHFETREPLQVARGQPVQQGRFHSSGRLNSPLSSPAPRSLPHRPRSTPSAQTPSATCFLVEVRFSLKPNVAYLALNSAALEEAHDIAVFGVCRHPVPGSRPIEAGALALTMACSRWAMARSASGISAIFASTSASPSSFFAPGLGVLPPSAPGRASSSNRRCFLSGFLLGSGWSCCLPQAQGEH